MARGILRVVLFNSLLVIDSKSFSMLDDYIFI
jgi:hypothetical protein